MVSATLAARAVPVPQLEERNVIAIANYKS
jgi:hypothetical protein